MSKIGGWPRPRSIVRIVADLPPPVEPLVHCSSHYKIGERTSVVQQVPLLWDSASSHSYWYLTKIFHTFWNPVFEFLARDKNRKASETLVRVFPLAQTSDYQSAIRFSFWFKKKTYKIQRWQDRKLPSLHNQPRNPEEPREISLSPNMMMKPMKVPNPRTPRDRPISKSGSLPRRWRELLVLHKVAILYYFLELIFPISPKSAVKVDTRSVRRSWRLALRTWRSRSIMLSKHSQRNSSKAMLRHPSLPFLNLE